MRTIPSVFIALIVQLPIPVGRNGPLTGFIVDLVVPFVYLFSFSNIQYLISLFHVELLIFLRLYGSGVVAVIGSDSGSSGSSGWSWDVELASVGGKSGMF
ncbi:hypothetical protein WAI453_006508 [Rhynchosporium graminicola]